MEKLCWLSPRKSTITPPGKNISDTHDSRYYNKNKACVYKRATY